MTPGLVSGVMTETVIVRVIVGQQQRPSEAMASRGDLEVLDGDLLERHGSGGDYSAPTPA